MKEVKDTEEIKNPNVHMYRPFLVQSLTQLLLLLTHSDEYQLEHRPEMFPPYLCRTLLIQSSQLLHVLPNFTGSAPAMSQGLFSCGISSCLCLIRISYIFVAMSAFVANKSFSSQGSL